MHGASLWRIVVDMNLRVVIAVAVLAGACGKKEDADVHVQAPGVDVKAGSDGKVEVTTPGTSTNVNGEAGKVDVTASGAAGAEAAAERLEAQVDQERAAGVEAAPAGTGAAGAGAATATVSDPVAAKYLDDYRAIKDRACACKDAACAKAAAAQARVARDEGASLSQAQREAIEKPLEVFEKQVEDCVEKLGD